MPEIDTFCLSDWIPRFPLASYRAGLVAPTFGPGEICHIEQIRQKAARLGDLGKSTECDVFVLGLGEPNRRDITKIGGLPYRPRGLPWPTSSETGEPLTFAGQFRFTESRDIVGPLPGDLLLMFFQDTCAWVFDKFTGPPVFEWYPLGIGDLVGEADLPPQSYRDWFPASYGVRHRTVDYINDVGLPLFQHAMPKGFIYWYDDDPQDQRDVETRAKFCRLDKLKIGGAPFWRYPNLIEKQGIATGAFLASLPQVVIVDEGAYPWINVPVANKKIRKTYGHSLIWLGEGIVHLFLDEAGNVTPRFEQYGIPDPPGVSEDGQFLF